MIEQPHNVEKVDDRNQTVWRRLRLQLERGRWLRASECGRNSGWWIELEGRTVGRLTSPEFVDMFRVSYRVEEASPEMLGDAGPWWECKLRFKNVATGEYAQNVIASGGVGDSGAQSRVAVRGLYLKPHGPAEEMGYRLPCLTRVLLWLLPGT
jgi:hypothetical protein